MFLSLILKIIKSKPGRALLNIPTTFYDIRFTDDDETTELEYWIESAVTSGTSKLATVWVKVADSLETADQDIYIYYGKSGASDGSDATNTFIQYHGSATADYLDPLVTTPDSNLYYRSRLSIAAGSHEIDWGISSVAGTTSDFIGTQSISASDDRKIRVGNNGSKSAVGESPAIDDLGYVISELKFLAGTSLRGYIDGDSIGVSLSSNLPAGEAMGLWLLETSGEITQTWSFIAKYASGEPGYHSIGGEESFVYPSTSFAWSNPTDVFAELIYSSNEYEFNSALTDYVSVAALSATQFVVGYEDSDYGRARVGTVSNIDGNASIIWSDNEYTFDSGYGEKVSVSALSATQFVVGYRRIYGYSRVGTVTGTGTGASIAFSTDAYQFNAAATTYISVSALGADATQFVVGYRDDGGDDYGHAKVGTVSGTGVDATITFSTGEYTFNSVFTEYISVSAISATQFVVGFQNVGGSGQGDARVGTVSGIDTGASIAWSAQLYEFNSAFTNNIFVSALGTNATQFVVGYQDNSGYGNAKVGTVSGVDTGASIAFSNGEYEFNNVGATYISVSALTSTQFIVVYRDNGGDDYGHARVGTVSGTGTDVSIAFSSNEYTFNDADTDYISVAALSPTQFAVGFKDDGGSDYGIAKIGTVYHAPQSYAYPSITREDPSNKIWVTAVGNDTTNYLFKARQSTNANDVSAWGTTVHSLDTSTSSNKYGTIVPLLTDNMYATWIDNATIEGKKFTSGGATKWIDGDVLRHQIH
jgi:hypothetical protein